MKTKRLIQTTITLSAILSVCSAIYAAGAGTTAADFLKLGLGPRAIAMGDAQTGVADDAYAIHTNPAGLAQLQTQEASFVHNSYIQDINQETLAYAYPHPRLGTFGASINYLNYGSIQGTDAVGTTTEDFNASDTLLSAAYAHDIYKEERYGSRLALGFTGKWIHQKLESASASAYAGDIGILYAPGIKWGSYLSGWRAGMSLRNLGSSVRFDQDSFNLPRTLTAGTSYTGNWRSESYTLAFDYRKPQVGQSSIGLGLELFTLNSFIFRCGYSSEGDLGNGIRVGAGIKFKAVQLDYAFTPLGDLGSAHRLGITLRLFAPKESSVLTAQRSYERGVKKFNGKRYTDAMVEFNKTLEIDPTHPQALDMMKKTYEEINQLLTH